MLIIYTCLQVNQEYRGGVFTRCYSTSDCSGPENRVLCQLFNTNVAEDLNHCCYENETTLEVTQKTYHLGSMVEHVKHVMVRLSA